MIYCSHEGFSEVAKKALRYTDTLDKFSYPALNNIRTFFSIHYELPVCDCGSDYYKKKSLTNVYSNEFICCYCGKSIFTRKPHYKYSWKEDKFKRVK